MNTNSNYEAMNHFISLASIHRQGILYAKQKQDYIAAITILSNGKELILDTYIDTLNAISELDWFGKKLINVWRKANAGMNLRHKKLETMLFNMLRELEERGVLWFVSDVKNPVIHAMDEQTVRQIRICRQDYCDWKTESLLIAYCADYEAAKAKLGDLHAAV